MPVSKAVRSLTALVLLFVGCIDMFATSHLTCGQIKSLLESQGFSGGFEGKIHISYMGDLDCAGSELQVFYYTWEETHPPGKAVHAAYRVLFF